MTSRESFDRNEPVLEGDEKVLPPEDDDPDAELDSPPGEHAEQKGRHIKPSDLENGMVVPDELENR